MQRPLHAGNGWWGRCLAIPGRLSSMAEITTIRAAYALANTRARHGAVLGQAGGA